MIPKLKTKEEQEKKEKRSKLFMTVFVVVILGASTAAYALMETSNETQKYNGFTFIRTNEGWQAKKMNFATSYLPQDVENISISGNPKPDDFSGNAYVIALGNDELTAANELVKTMPLKKVTLACSPENENESFCAELPLKSCGDASPENPIIIFSEANDTNNTKIEYSNYCLKIIGEPLKAADRIIFAFYGIIS